ncbi:MAG: protoheme IX farnesyltransferase [Acidimicrobiales bacterium]|nr:MAG: protoheme IX farnesyltransferase [Acidimicrobiales bacterium]
MVGRRVVPAGSCLERSPGPVTTLLDAAVAAQPAVSEARIGQSHNVQLRRQRIKVVLGGYLALTKPRIIELLLVSTLPTMFLAARGIPSLGLVLTTLLGGALAAGSANALNCVVDRDIDQLMRRTARRPLPRHTVTPRAATIFGLGLGALSMALLAVAANLLAAGLALTAIVFYVVVYTMLLKRRTRQNIVWGGAAGCMPVLIGWSAVTGSLEWPALALFGVIFFWTPPHYWPLAMRYADDYARAGVPMLPVVAAPQVVTRQIMAHSLAMVACSLALWPLAMGWIYGVSATMLGGWFVFCAYRLHACIRRQELAPRPMLLFHASITYLTLLFAAIAVDVLV